MKKLLIAAMAASIVMAFTGCGSDEDSSSKADTSAASTTTTAAEDEKAPEADTEGNSEAADETEESTADSEAAVSDNSEVSDDTSAAEADMNDFTAGKFFSFEADEANWNTAEDAFGNTTVTYIGTDIPEANSTCFMLFNSEEAEDLELLTFYDIAPLFVSSMGLGDDFVVDKEEATEFNGYDAYVIDGNYTQSGNEFAIKIILCREKTKLVVIATMAYSDAAEAIQPEFQKVLDTVKIV